MVRRGFGVAGLGLALVTAALLACPPGAGAKHFLRDGNSFKLSLTASASQHTVGQKALVGTVRCNLACSYTGVGVVAIQGSNKQLTSATKSGTLAAGHSATLRLTLSSSELSQIKRALEAHKYVRAQIGAAAQDAAGQQLKRTTSFTVEH